MTEKKITLTLLTLITLGLTTPIFAEDQTNPIANNQASLSRGRQLYMKNCASCHGKDGRGDTPLGKVLKTIPNLTNPSMNNRSDRELFDTITEGVPPMPSFNKLSEKDRWDLVNFIRTFTGESKQ